MMFFAYGLIGLFASGRSASEDIVFETSSEKNLMEERTILIDVEGAVVKPGLYKLPLNSRIQDGLVAAGGLSLSADRSYVSKNLNLAIMLIDGAKIYIPILGEAVESSGVLSASSQVNINTSSQSQLEELPGIGPATALKIINGRPYSSIEELSSKKIVGSKVFDQIKDKISVY